MIKDPELGAEIAVVERAGLPPAESRRRSSSDRAAPSTRCSAVAGRGGPVHRTSRAGLVLAQAEEGGMAQLAVLGALGEAELGDQLAARPSHVARSRGGSANGEWARAPSGARRRLQIGERRLGEARADLARVAQRAAVPGADQQGAEMLAGARAAP